MRAPDPGVPLVSVVMPAFNAAATIREAIDSVLAQSQRSLELLVCDDASADRTRALVEACTDPRVRLLDHARNRGAGAARQTAIAAARGTWVAFIDADDAWHPERLATLLAEARDGELVFDDTLLLHQADAGTRPFRRLRGARAFGARGASVVVPLPDYVRSERLLMHPVVPLAALRDSGVSQSSRPFAEDAEMYIRLGIAGMPFRYVPKAMYFYRLTPGSLTHGGGRGEMRRMLQALAAEPGLTPALEAAFAAKIRRVARDEVLHRALAASREGRVLDALVDIARHPASWPRILRRLPGHLRYRVHGWLAGARRR